MALRSLALGILLSVMMGSTGSQTSQDSSLPVALRSDSLRALLPQGEAQVTVMGLTSPPDLNALSQRFREAVSQDPGWLQQYIADVNASPGETLPYHPKMGLSRDEYDEMIRLLGEIVMVPSRAATLTVTEAGGRFTLGGEPDLPRFSGVTVDADAMTIVTPFATLTEAERVLPHSGQTITGQWEGYGWVYDDVDPESGTGVRVSFDLGRLVESGDGLLHYDAKRMEDGVLVDRVKWTLTYPLDAR